jgi:hypothetical protein
MPATAGTFRRHSLHLEKMHAHFFEMRAKE